MTPKQALNLLLSNPSTLSWEERNTLIYPHIFSPGNTMNIWEAFNPFTCIDTLDIAIVNASGGSAAGQPCKQGQTAKHTGCTPKSGTGTYVGGKKGGKVKGGSFKGSQADSRSDRRAGKANASGTDKASGRMAGKTSTTGDEGPDSQGVGKSAATDRKTTGVVKKDKSSEGDTNPQDKEALDAVNARLDRYATIFEKKGDTDAAEWMGMLKDHINEHGVDHAMEALGEQRTGGFQGKVQYTGSYDEIGETQKETDFIHRYLEKAGVTLIHGNTAVDPNAPMVSSWSEANLAQEGRNLGPKKLGDYIPTDATVKDKLEETKNLPGLESTEDIHKVIGEKVTNFTPDILKKLDDTYGKGGWIVKSYGAEAYAGFGVFFPDRIKQIQSDAKAVIADAGSQLKDKGYKIARDDSGTAIGIMESGKGKQLLHFGSAEFDSLPKGVKNLGKQVQQAAPSENGTRLPTSPEDSLQNNYGVTLKRDKEGVPIGVVDWDGREHSLDSKHVAKMEEQDGGAMGHELHRALEADEWRRKEGFATEPKFMVGPAFKAVGVSAEDRASGATWETANEGRVHCITRDGKAEVVPYATLAGRGDSMPAVFATKDVKDMEKAVQDAVNNLPASERSGQLYAPDVVKTKDGWKVLELNPSAAGGGSDWLGRNPFVIDAVASHAVGREPLHARFIRDLLNKVTWKGDKATEKETTDQPKAQEKETKTEIIKSTSSASGQPCKAGQSAVRTGCIPKSKTPDATPEIDKNLDKLNPGLDQPIGGKVKGGKLQTDSKVSKVDDKETGDTSEKEDDKGEDITAKPGHKYHYFDSADHLEETLKPTGDDSKREGFAKSGRIGPGYASTASRPGTEATMHPFEVEIEHKGKAKGDWDSVKLNKDSIKRVFVNRGEKGNGEYDRTTSGRRVQVDVDRELDKLKKLLPNAKFVDVNGVHTESGGRKLVKESKRLKDDSPQENRWLPLENWWLPIEKKNTLVIEL